MPQLIVMSRRGAARQVALQSVRTTLGRDDANLLVINSHRASRHHAVLIQQGGQVWVRDLDSSNGTWVNDERIACCRLEHGDTVGIGDCQLRFLNRAAADHSATVTLSLASAHGVLAAMQSAPRAGALAAWR